ncbi:MAG: hypothetical protein KDA84_21660 [Planctomycetaceae bacterium]|nr:hypothetical protein [Planctomycetaceae bacterium]
MPKISRPNRPLADVNVLPQNDGSAEVVACFMPDIDVLVGEGESRAVLALDASRSIKTMYGGGAFGSSPNYVQAVARKLGSILSEVSRSGKVTISYWALGMGEDIELAGEFDESGCSNAAITGPKTKKWGKGTQLLPTIRYIAETVDQGSEWTMGVIITDGIIEDEKACSDYCLQLGENIKKAVDGGTRRKDSFKLVLIGVGEEVDVGQLERFDDMFEGTPLADDVDLFSHGIAADMQDEDDILNVVFGELMNEETIVASTGCILDPSGNEIKNFSDGLPGKFRFTLPKGSTSFTVHTPQGDVVQDISEAL